MEKNSLIKYGVIRIVLIQPPYLPTLPNNVGGIVQKANTNHIKEVAMTLIKKSIGVLIALKIEKNL